MKRTMLCATVMAWIMGTYADTPTEQACDCTAQMQGVELGDERSARPFTLSTHKPNYALPISYNRKTNPDGLTQEGTKPRVDSLEIQFQFSLKLLLANVAQDFPLYVAYTNRSFWQAYNNVLSSPFRDTNHEPEIFMQFPLNISIGDWKQSHIFAGFVHQSNGRSLPLSRSWNRIYIEWVSQIDNWTFSLKPWYRLPERDKKNPLDTRGDDNPDIGSYMGSFEFRTDWRFHKHTISAMVRNNFSRTNRGALDLTWSYPLSGDIDWYIKYFYGYGETLLDYDYLNNTIGLGFAISNW